MPLLSLLSPSSDFHSVEVSSPDANNVPKSPEGDSGSCATSEFSVTKIESDDKATHFYTGLPSWSVFLHLYSFLSSFMCTTGPRLFTNKQNELLIVLMKLRLNLMMEDLARRLESVWGQYHV